MAKTIGKDKVSVTRARAADTEAEPVGDRPNDEPRDEDMLDAATDDTLDAADGEDEDDVAANDEIDDEIVVANTSAASTAVTHRPAAAVTRDRFQAPRWMLANGVTRFIAESINELLKVSWPTGAEAWQMTLVVIAISVVVAAILSLADLGLIRALSWVVGLGH